jgi:exonuclease VII small subunit
MATLNTGKKPGCVFCDGLEFKFSDGLGDKLMYCCDKCWVQKVHGGLFTKFLRGPESSLLKEWTPDGIGAITTQNGTPVTAYGLWVEINCPKYYTLESGATCSMCTPWTSRQEHRAYFCYKCCRDYTGLIIKAIDTIVGSGKVFSALHGGHGNLVSFHSTQAGDARKRRATLTEGDVSRALASESPLTKIMEARFSVVLSENNQDHTELMRKNAELTTAIEEQNKTIDVSMKCIEESGIGKLIRDNAELNNSIREWQYAMELVNQERKRAMKRERAIQDALQKRERAIQEWELAIQEREQCTARNCSNCGKLFDDHVQKFCIACGTQYFVPEIQVKTTTANRVKKCRFFGTPKGCTKGNGCTFSHAM